MEPGQRFEVLRISVPGDGGVTVFRSPGGGTETVLEAYSITQKRIAPKSFPFFSLLDYSVHNGYLYQETKNEFGIEKIRIVAAEGNYMVISRDGRLPFEQNRYKIAPTLAMVVASVIV